MEPIGQSSVALTARELVIHTEPLGLASPSLHRGSARQSVVQAQVPLAPQEQLDGMHSVLVVRQVRAAGFEPGQVPASVPASLHKGSARQSVVQLQVPLAPQEQLDGMHSVLVVRQVRAAGFEPGQVPASVPASLHKGSARQSVVQLQVPLAPQEQLDGMHSSLVVRQVRAAGFEPGQLGTAASAVLQVESWTEYTPGVMGEPGRTAR